MSSIATGLSYGTASGPRHAETAVRRAMDRAGLDHATSVLLFLSPDFAADPTPTLRAAARTAGCTQVFGCTGAGLLTESDWVLDAPGAAAMVFGGPVALRPLMDDTPREAVLSVCTPQGLAAEWLDQPLRRLGAVASDVVEHGKFAVWSGGRVQASGCADARIAGARCSVTVSQGVRALTAPIEVAEANGFEVLRLGHYPALNVLVKSLPIDVQDMEHIPLHLLIGGVTFGDPDTAIPDGRYRLNNIIGADPENRSITLSQPLNPGERLFWAMRDTLVSERDMRETVRRGYARLGQLPDFALMFPCVARGPSFYGDRERDMDQLRAQFPGLPCIGFYGNGEIGPLDEENHLYHYSTVLGLFATG